jgi:hypothetical protein
MPRCSAMLLSTAHARCSDSSARSRAAMACRSRRSSASVACICASAIDASFGTVSASGSGLTLAAARCSAAPRGPVAPGRCAGGGGIDGAVTCGGDRRMDGRAHRSGVASGCCCCGGGGGGVGIGASTAALSADGASSRGVAHAATGGCGSPCDCASSSECCGGVAEPAGDADSGSGSCGATSVCGGAAGGMSAGSKPSSSPKTARTPEAKTGTGGVWCAAFGGGAFPCPGAAGFRGGLSAAAPRASGSADSAVSGCRITDTDESDTGAAVAGITRDERFGVRTDRSASLSRCWRSANRVISSRPRAFDSVSASGVAARGGTLTARKADAPSASVKRTGAISSR